MRSSCWKEVPTGVVGAACTGRGFAASWWPGRGSTPLTAAADTAIAPMSGTAGRATTTRRRHFGASGSATASRCSRSSRGAAPGEPPRPEQPRLGAPAEAGDLVAVGLDDVAGDLGGAVLGRRGGDVE